MSTTTAVARRDAVTDVCVAINDDDFKAKVKAALEDARMVDRFIRVATTAVQLNPEVIEKGTKASVLTSLIRMAQDGLVPDGKEAALVLFGNKATYMPMIGGFRRKAAEHGFSLTAQVVYERDGFDYELGAQPSVHHKPVRLGEERGEGIGAYAVAVHSTLGTFIEVMSKQEIEVVKSVSRAKGGDLWVKWWPEAWRKTVARRLFKQLPLGADDRTASMLAVDDEGFDLSPGPLADLPAVDPSEEWEETEGEVMDEGEQGALA